MDFIISYLKVSFPAAIAIILLIYLSGLDLQNTYADAWIASSSDHLGITKEDYLLSVWINEDAYTMTDDESEATKRVPIRVTNAGAQSLGGNNRPWNLLITADSHSSIRLDNIRQVESNIQVKEITTDSESRINLEFGLFYPGEYIEILVKVPVSDKKVRKYLHWNSNNPVDLKISTTRHDPNIGPPTKFGNVVFIASLALFGIIYSFAAYSYALEFIRDESAFWRIHIILVTGLACLSLAIVHTVLVTKIVLLISYPFL